MVQILERIKDDKDDNADALNLLCYYCQFFEKAAPVFHPGDARNFEEFERQKDELRNAVFDPEQNQHHAEYVAFWQNLK